MISTFNSINGTVLNDVILGTGGNDRIYAGDGNDTVGGGLGNDYIDTGDGDDVSAIDPLTGFFDDPGDDVYETRGGNDIIEMGSGNDFCYAGAGNDLVGGGIGDDTLWGTWGDDFLTGGQGNFDPLLGPVGVSGNDELDGGEGNDYLLGEDGDDLLIGNDVWYYDSKGDRISTFSDTLYGGNGNDTLRSGAGADFLIGGEGNDSLQLKTRFSMGHSLFLSGAEGTDELVIIANAFGTESSSVDLRSSTLFMLEGLRLQFSADAYTTKTMTVHLSAAQFNGLSTFRGTNMDDRAERLVIDISGSASFNGSVPLFVGLSNPLDDVRIVGATAAANQITGTRISDHIEGLGGNDRLTGLGGNDSLYGGDGNDSLYGGSGANLLEGGANDDLIQTSGASSRLSGGEGNDTLDASGFVDTGDITLTGGVGDDSFIIVAAPVISVAGGGTNPARRFTIQGEGGYDAVTLRDPTAGAQPVFATYSYDLAQSSLSGVENLRIEASGTMYQLSLNLDASTFATGWPTEITLLGDAASAALIYVTLQMGTETALNLSGVSFANWGGTVLRIDAASDAGKSIVGSHLADAINSGRGADTLRGGLGEDTIRGGEGGDQLFGDNGADRILADGGVDRLFGGADADSLFGGTGNDSLRGGLGNDSLAGDDDLDLLMGEAGADRLSGGNGNDTIIGGTGSDTLTGDAGSDTFVFNAVNDSRGTVRDTITDFTSGIDVIDLRGFGQPLSLIGTAAFSASGQGEIRVLSSGVVLIDVNGDGTTDASILLSPAVTLTASDFLTVV